MKELRYERKYLLQHVDFRAVMAEVRQHPSGFAIQYPDRQVNNIYFDNPELDAMNANLSGINCF